MYSLLLQIGELRYQQTCLGLYLLKSFILVTIVAKPILLTKFSLIIAEVPTSPVWTVIISFNLCCLDELFLVKFSSKKICSLNINLFSFISEFLIKGMPFLHKILS